MRIKSKSRASTRPKGRVASKMPKIEFNMRAINAIKKRKKKVGKRRSKPKGGVVQMLHPLRGNG